jgi:NitT/TauT family transport system substrate-binding protein
LLDCSIWNILFVVSDDPDIESVTDLAGKTVVVPYQGAVPDAIFRYVLANQGVDPETDIDIYYAPDPVQASQLLLSGQEHYALLSEPSATSVLRRASASGITLYHNLNMGTEWEIATGGNSRSAIAGTVVLGDMAGNDEGVRRFREEYEKAIEWMLDNPEEAGELGARVLAEQGFTAEVLTESMQNIDWDYVPAEDARTDIQRFFEAMAELSPDYIGGELPDDAFYYGSQG